MVASISSRRGFEPTLFDKLFDESPGTPQETTIQRLTLDQLKERVASDLEALLNSRCAPSDGVMAGFPMASRSILCFGLPDFCGMTLANPADRRRVCEAIERAIARHEQRLQDVRVALDVVEERQTNQLRFSIAALLVVNPAREVVSFDALLQPSTLQYSVSRARRGAAA